MWDQEGCHTDTSKALKRLKMSYYTNKPSVYHEGNIIVRNYTEDQARMDIRKEDVVQTRNAGTTHRKR